MKRFFKSMMIFLSFVWMIFLSSICILLIIFVLSLCILKCL
ncbi:hypothetical protein QTI81_01915 [Clostridium perfringens]|nr:hypothetical protein [Clostridium perfringens]MDM0936534.1 hypothetical protein [Clostridium perfringens]